MSKRAADSRKAGRREIQAARPSRFGWAGLIDFARRRAGSLAITAYGILLAVFSLGYLRIALARSWFFSSDEYVFAAEVIRFLHLDYHQYYFDMPGTPYMMLTAVLWSIFHPLAGWLGWDYPPTGTIAFAYQHIDWLFTLLRAETLLFYAISLVLLVTLARKLLNPAGAVVAGLVLTMSPIYAKYSSFSRVESMAICLILAALLVVYRGLDKTPQLLGEALSWRDRMIAAGFLCGIAAGARLHSMTASGTLLFFILLCDPRVERRDEYPRWVRRMSRIALPLVTAAGVVAWWLVRRRILVEYPYAGSLLIKAAVAMVAGPAVLALLYRISGTRRLLVRTVNPEVIKLLIGGICGFLISNPTVIPQYDDFLRSMNFYSGSYIDWARTTWPLWRNIRWYVGFYGGVFAPDKILLLLSLSGALWIAASRDRRVVPYLIALLAFFLSKPINLIAAPHHTLLWLPFFAIVTAYPIARLYDMVRGPAASGRNRRRLAVGTAVAATVWIGVLLTNGPANAAAEVRSSQARLDNIEKATDWIHDNTPNNSTVAFGYFCFNPDVFYTIVQSMNVPVPGASLDPRRHLVWWGRRGALSGIAGYLCTTPGIGADQQHDNLASSDPEHLADPYKEPEYQRVVSFGHDFDEVDVFRFDFRDAASRPK